MSEEASLEDRASPVRRRSSAPAGNGEAASHLPLEGGDWRKRHPAQMVRPSPIVTFNHKWGHDALEETESAPARIPRFNVGVGGGGGGGEGGDSRDDVNREMMNTRSATYP